LSICGIGCSSRRAQLHEYFEEISEIICQNICVGRRQLIYRCGVLEFDVDKISIISSGG
jgi:hypothetical protein